MILLLYRYLCLYQTNLKFSKHHVELIIEITGNHSKSSSKRLRCIIHDGHLGEVKLFIAINKLRIRNRFECLSEWDRCYFISSSALLFVIHQ